MSRIRSVHPGFFKDDRLVPCSAFARLLFIGLGVEADDKGIFEWKPVTIKMNVFPGDNVDIGELLAELVDADAVRQFEAGGKRYGAIRNFRKYQKPKTPNDVYPMADGIAEYVSLPQKEETPASERTVFLPKGEKSFQMEDGGGKREEEKKKEAPQPPSGEQAGALFDRLREIYPPSRNTKLERAEKLFLRLSQADQELAVEQARPFEIQMRTEASERNRPSWDQQKFTPGMDTWLRDGRFRPSAPAKPAVTLPVLRQDDPLVPVIEKLRGKPIIFGTKGTTTVTPAEIEQARQVAA